jgi:hypothetical protein
MISTKGLRLASGLIAAACAASACALDEPDQASRLDQAITDSALASLRGQVLRRDVDGFFGTFDFDAFTIAIVNVQSPPILRECERTLVPAGNGTCEITICPDGIPEPSNISAGTARLRGGLQDFTLTPRADGIYDATFAEGPLFEGGERLFMSLSGQLRPPVVLPAARLVEAPGKSAAITSARPSTLSRQEPFTSTWTGASRPATMRLNFESDEKVLITDEIFISKYQLACTFDGSAGSGTIPVAALSRFPVVVGSYNYRVEIEETQDIASQRLTFGLGVPAANGEFQPLVLD